MSKVNVRATINANIKQNGNQEITGQILNAVLNTMVDNYADQDELSVILGQFETNVQQEIQEFKDDVNTKVETFEEKVNTEIENKADKDGRYPAMSVGSAEALVSRGTPVAEEFYAKIAASSGAAEVKRLKGNTLVWNQWLKRNNWSVETINGITFTANADSSITMNGTATAYAYLGMYQGTCVQGHKYLIMGGGDTFSFGLFTSATGMSTGLVSAAIITCGLSQIGGSASVFIPEGVTLNNVKVYPVFIDLTQMFGAGNEPSTYEDFLRLAPKVADPYAYDEGTIVPFKDAAIKTTGRNLWDEEWEKGRLGADGLKFDDGRSWVCKNFIPVIGGQTIFIGGADIGVCQYDANRQFIEFAYRTNAELSLNGNTRYINIYQDGVRDYQHNVCINVSDPSFNGQYEPYISHTLPIDTDFEVGGENFFPNGLNGIGDVRDEVTQTKAIKRFGVVDMGELDYHQSETHTFYAAVPGKSIRGYNIISPIYINAGEAAWEQYTDRGNMTVGSESGSNILYFANGNYSDIPSFKAAMQGVLLVYELATPVEADVNFNGVFITTKNGLVEVTGEMPLMADIVEAKDYIGIIEDLVRRVTALEER